MNPDDLLYASSHEWVQKGNPATVGISQFAQDQLGDVVFVELPAVGATLTAGEPFGSVESVKTVSDVYAPISGTVVEVNTRLSDDPALINTSPFGDGWLIRLDVSDDAGYAALLDRASYESTAGH